MKIRAIETRYNGRYMRSRLEARWAVFFDAMKIPWEYEIRGFTIGDDKYLPDFELPSFGWHVEIKPEHIPDRDQNRLNRIFANWQEFETELVVIRGIPSLGRYSIRMSKDPGECLWTFAPCRRCEGVCIVMDSGWGDVGKHDCSSEKWPIEDDDRIMGAYDRAMRYEFDHLTKGSK